MNSYESLWLIRFPWRMPLLPLRNKANSIAKIMSIWVKFGFRGLFLVCEGNPSQTRNSPRKPILTHIDIIFAKQFKFVRTTLVNRDIGNGTASYKWMLSSCVSARLSEIAGQSEARNKALHACSRHAPRVVATPNSPTSEPIIDIAAFHILRLCPRGSKLSKVITTTLIRELSSKQP